MLVRMSFTITISLFPAGWLCNFMFGCYEQSEASSAHAEIQILQVGVFHGDEVSAKSGEVWLGLYLTPDGYALIPSRITVEAVYDPLVDREGEKTGKTVSVDKQTLPLFLIKGLETPERKFIKTVSTEETILTPGKSIDLTFDDKNEYHLTAYGEGSLEQIRFTSLRNYTLELSKGPFSQELLAYESTNDAIPSLLWAGDLDGDGQLDLLVNATPHYIVYSAPVLFLSSRAGDGNLIQKVAMFVATGGC